MKADSVFWFTRLYLCLSTRFSLFSFPFVDAGRIRALFGSNALIWPLSPSLNGVPPAGVVEVATGLTGVNCSKSFFRGTSLELSSSIL